MRPKISPKPRTARFLEKTLGQHSQPEGLSTFTANELQATDFPPLKFLVEGLITEGLTLLAGKPKMGKSWMALDIAMSVAIGCEALGNRPCKKGVALYCALEDNPRRLRRRMLHNYIKSTGRWIFTLRPRWIGWTKVDSVTSRTGSPNIGLA